MKAVKIVGVLLLVYVVIVVAFESLLGYIQPAGEGTIVITTTDEDGQSNDRVVSRIMHDEKLYVAANHWPRAWYHQTLANPNVRVTINGSVGEYVAVPVVDPEHSEVDAAHSLGPIFRVLTGFPPRYFVRLDPR
jgi:F420H(2)-dependent quinone reductase